MAKPKLAINKSEHHVEEIDAGKKDSRRTCAMLESGTPYSPGNCRLGWNSDLTSTEKSGRDRNDNAASSSQVLHRDDNPFSRYREIAASGESALKYRETGARSSEPTHRGEIDTPVSRNLKYSIH